MGLNPTNEVMEESIEIGAANKQTYKSSLTTNETAKIVVLDKQKRADNIPTLI